MNKPNVTSNFRISIEFGSILKYPNVSPSVCHINLTFGTSALLYTAISCISKFGSAERKLLLGGETSKLRNKASELANLVWSQFFVWYQALCIREFHPRILPVSIPCDAIRFGQHCLIQWIAAWMSQAITFYKCRLIILISKIFGWYSRAVEISRCQKNNALNGSSFNTTL